MLYDELKCKMSIWPAVVPEGFELTEILKLLFTPEEAEILSSDAFSAPFQDYKTSKEIALCVHKSEEKVRKIMESLEKRKLVFTFVSKTGDKYYSLFPAEPAVIGFFVEAAEPDVQKKISPLFERVFRNRIVMGEGTSKHMWGRIVLLDQKIVVINEILTFEKVSELIRGARNISVAQCFCKTKTQCEHPTEVCMALDEGAEFVVEKGIARFVSVEEGLHILEETEKAGLVHISTNTGRGSKFICNCCTCSCFLLGKLTEAENPREFATSGLIPAIDHKKCVLCGKCIEICPFDAYFYEEGKICYKEHRCIGCALCAHNCPFGAIYMIPSFINENKRNIFQNGIAKEITR